MNDNRETPEVNARVIVQRPPDNFTQIANEVLYAGLKDIKGKDYSNLPPLSYKALGVFIALRSFDHRGEGYAWPGINLLAAVARIGRTSVKEAVTELERVGLVAIESGKLAGSSNTYIVAWTFPEGNTVGHPDQGGGRHATRGGRHATRGGRHTTTGWSPRDHEEDK